MAEGKHGKLRDITIRPAEGGWTVSVGYEPEEKDDKGSKDACCGPSWVPPRDYVFTDRAALLRHIEDCLGGPAKKDNGAAQRIKGFSKGAKG